MLKYLQAGGDLCDVKIGVKSKGERDALVKALREHFGAVPISSSSQSSSGSGSGSSSSSGW